MNGPILPLLALSLLSTSLRGESWPQFRGADGSAALAAGAELATEWSDAKNLRWKVALPGPGSSSPVFWGDRLFVTCYVGYGTNIWEPGDPEGLGRQLICLDRESGKILWKQTITLTNPEDDFRGYIMEHGYASSTPVTDGENVYAFFGKSGVHAFSIDGEPLWNQQVGKDSSNRRWGSGASPILHGDLLIVNAADEGRAVIAFDKKTGEERWRRESKALELAYGTPQVRKSGDGPAELVLAMPYEVWGLDPITGEAIWTTETEMPGNICPSVVTTNDMVFAFGGYPKKSSIGIKDGKILWTGKSTTYVPTPLEFEGHLYWVSDDAEAICMEAATGKIITKRKVEGLEGSKARSFYASILRAGDKLIAVSRRSGTFVFEADPEMKQLSKNLLGDESDFNATPALAGDSLYLRSNKFLYAIGK
jgi:outer membrane protein assembly factor BamB